MKLIVRTFVSAIFMLTGVINAMAIEEASYKVVKAAGIFELRDYASHILAEIVVGGDLENAGNKAFRRIFRYITGENRSQGKISMTAPVSQEAAGEKITMTAPVSQQRVQNKWAVSFMMPSSYTMETLPTPADPGITLRQIPARQLAAVRYSGSWSEKNYLCYKGELEKWIRDNGLTISGEPIWARYNPPFTLWFMRRNEILIPILAAEGTRDFPSIK